MEEESIDDALEWRGIVVRFTPEMGIPDLDRAIASVDGKRFTGALTEPFAHYRIVHIVSDQSMNRYYLTQRGRDVGCVFGVEGGFATAHFVDGKFRRILRSSEIAQALDLTR
jgi:hypothetical protein